MIGDEIRKERKRAGLTQEQLAAKAGVHRTYISMLERNIYKPTVDVLIRICKHLGVKAHELVRRVEE